MPLVVVGRTHYQYGKRLWEIIGNLKDFGVGRMVVRSTFERYPEPSYLKIVSARPDFDTGRPHMDEDNLRGKVLAERVFRGRSHGIVDISQPAYKTDYKLIPKREEHKYTDAFNKYIAPDVKIYPQIVPMPPLLRMIAIRKNYESKLIKVVLRTSVGNNYRVAEDGEIPDAELTVGIGTPTSPQLYEDVIGSK